LATSALFRFLGFPGKPDCHLCLQHDGYPTGAAWRLALSLRHSPQPSDLLSGFLATQPSAILLDQESDAVDATYRYWLELCGDATAPIQVRAWIRLPGSTAWHPRCGPLSLAAFIGRFLPGELELPPPT
jgi:hypothetical protein